MTRLDPPAALTTHPLLVVLRAPAASAYRPVIDALVDGGIRAVEVTLTTPDTLDAFPELRASFPDEVAIGVGTVTHPAEAREAVVRGADFLVTPSFDAALAQALPSLSIPVIAGGLTPSELHAAWVAGASAVKLFPASTVGAGYLRQVHGPFPGLPVIPSGGIDSDGAVTWMRAGAIAVSVGGPLLQDAFDGGDLAALAQRCRELLGDIVQAREGAA